MSRFYCSISLFCSSPTILSIGAYLPSDSVGCLELVYLHGINEVERTSSFLDGVVIEDAEEWSISPELALAIKQHFAYHAGASDFEIQSGLQWEIEVERL